MDMLVKLYTLPSLEKELERMEQNNIRIIRAFPPNRDRVLRFVNSLTGELAAGEAACCFSKKTPSMFIAVRENKILGYACYNATAPDYFGPTQVLDSEQGKGIGKALLIASLHALKDEGYGYAIIGGIGPEKFYEKTVGATLIKGSSPGLYANMLPKE